MRTGCRTARHDGYRSALSLLLERLGAAGDLELATGPLVERGPAEPDDLAGAGVHMKRQVVAWPDVSGDLAVHLDRETAAGAEDAQHEVLVVVQHQGPVEGRVRCGGDHEQPLDPRGHDGAAGRE